MDYQKFIQENNIIDWLLKYHYSIESEAFKTDDVVNGTLEEALAEKLFEEHNFSGTDSDKYAREIMALVRVDVISEIESLDQEAIDNYEDAKLDYQSLVGEK